MQEDERALAEQTAVEAGRALAIHQSGWRDVTGGIGKDVKAAADKRAEAVILERLAAGSSHAVLTEETGWHGAGDRTGSFWVVDPLDGTANYVKGAPLCCVAIGLMRAGRPGLGVVYDFARDELFSGEVGAGAWLNGHPIHVSTVERIEQAALGTGLPARRNFGDQAMASFGRELARWRKVRMIGAAALSLAWTAAGRFDAHREEATMLWDVVAGAALVEAAGGKVVITPREEPEMVDIAADNGRLITRSG